MVDSDHTHWNCGPYSCLTWRDGQSATVAGAVRRARDGELLANVTLHERFGAERLGSILDYVAMRLRRPPGVWNMAGVPVADVLLVQCPSKITNSEPWRPTHPLSLADDLSIIPVSQELREAIESACEAPGIDRTIAIDLRARPLFAIVRDPVPAEPVFAWDPDERIRTCLALARLIRPVSIGTRYSARVTGNLHGEALELFAGAVYGLGASAWTAEPESDWLRAEDFTQLRDLLASYDQRRFEPGSRLQRAFWHHEYAALTQTLEVRWPLVATALEALLGTTGDRATQQFIKRIPMLAAAAGAPPISIRDARQMWGLRSKFSHGEPHSGLSEAEYELYRRMEDVLRATLRRAVTDDLFRAYFADRDAVDAAFPISPPAPKAVTCPECSHRFVER